MSQILFRAAMNIKDEVISQVSDDEIMDDIELLDTLILIEKKIDEPLASAEDPEIENDLLLLPFVETLLILNVIDIELRTKSVNKLINSNWADRCNELEAEERILKGYLKSAENYWMKIFIHIEMQKIISDYPQVIESEIDYENIWFEEITRRVRKEEMLKLMQEMNSSLIDLEEEKKVISSEELMTIEFLNALFEATDEWEKIFINDNLVIIANQLIEQSTNSLILASTISRGASKSNMFYYIDRRQEHIGSEASSSSEDG
jgi:hypothetical protein